MNVVLRILPLIMLVRGVLAAAAATGPVAPASRAELLAQEHTAAPVPPPVPKAPIDLPDDWDRAPISIHFADPPAGPSSVRRVSRNDGRLYLEIRASQNPIRGAAEIKQGGRTIAQAQCDGSLWLSLKPRIARISIRVFPGDTEVTTPTTLVEVRGPRLFVNGEPFLVKGAMGRGALSPSDAAYVHSLGINTLRGLSARADCERYGFMNIASLNLGPEATTQVMKAPDAQFEQIIPKCLDWLAANSPDAIASPNTLILQLGNERTGPGEDPPGAQRLTPGRRHVAQLLAAARNFVKPLAPMLPVGYANQDLGFLTPDCMDVYMHNSFLDKDRYGYPWPDFMKWQGCPPRPFVNSEFGANRYLCQAYLKGPNNPFLERVHAWNFPNRWDEFMEHGTAGGSIYSLYDLDAPRDQGCSCFGILTFDRKPKLACWEVGRMWRDFEVAPARDAGLAISYKRDYWARDCRLTITPPDEKPVTHALDDFKPQSSRTVSIGDVPRSARWSIDFTTHGGLVGRASGACPADLEEKDFVASLKSRDTYPFLSELFDTQVLTAAGKPAPHTLAEMTNRDGVIPVALRKRNGVTYLLLIARENADGPDGPIRHGLNLEVGFAGKVVKVNDMTGEPLPEAVTSVPISGGQRLTNIDAARIPGPIGQRCQNSFTLPVYRITP